MIYAGGISSGVDFKRSAHRDRGFLLSMKAKIMKNIRLFSSFLSLLLWTSANVLFCSAQTVQLPSYQPLGASTTVLAPDGGSVNIGGISRSSSGSRSYGTPVLPFQNRSYGSTVSTSTMKTSVQIIDLHEMDEQILNSSSSAVRRPGTPLSPTDYFQQRLDRASEPDSEPNLSGMMNAHDGIRSQIRIRASEGDETQRRQTLQQSLNLSSGGVKEDATETVDSRELNKELNLSPKALPKSSSSGKRHDAETKKTLSEKDHSALILAKKGYAAEKEGKKTLALSYYQQAEELAEGKLLQKIQKRKASLLEN